MYRHIVSSFHDSLGDTRSVYRWSACTNKEYTNEITFFFGTLDKIYFAIRGKNGLKDKIFVLSK